MGAQNLIASVLEDHKTAKDRLNEFLNLPEATREDGFCELVHMLVAHEVAEEVVVYPAFRRQFPADDAVAEDRIGEQSEAESLLATMEDLDVTDPEFTRLFSELRDAVIEHARLEEETIFAPLSAACSEETLARLGDEYTQAKESAPTHPHPHVPATGKAGATLVGLADRARDAVQSALAPESRAS